jgi:uncharacterized membrane protein YbhN (UPF0104 family)
MGTSQLAHADATTAADTPRRWITSWTGTAAGGALGLTALWLAFRTVDWTTVAGLLQTGGVPLLLIVLAAYLPGMALDTLAWGRLLTLLGRPAPFGRLLETLVAAEALRMSLPGGAMLADSLTPAMLRARCATPIPDGAASLAMRKCALGVSQAGFLLAAATLGAPLLRAAAKSAETPWLEASLVGSAFVVLGLSLLAALVLAGAGTGDALWRALHRLPIASLRRALASRRTAFGRFDADAARLLRSRAAWVTLVPFAAAWLCEAAETWLLLQLLGASVSFPEALAIEAAASILRQSGVVVPGGLGVQEVGYVLLITATGVPNPIPLTAAFAVMKRLKEAVWTVTGYALLARGGA